VRLYAVETGGSVEVGGDMTALFEIMTYSYEPGYIDQARLVRIDGALAGAVRSTSSTAGGVFEVGAVESDCTIHEFAGAHS
jgi:cytoskeletal protein CcmA (bactofilin family)